MRNSQRGSTKSWEEQQMARTFNLSDWRLLLKEEDIPLIWRPVFHCRGRIQHHRSLKRLKQHGGYSPKSWICTIRIIWDGSFVTITKILSVKWALYWPLRVLKSGDQLFYPPHSLGKRICYRSTQQRFTPCLYASSSSSCWGWIATENHKSIRVLESRPATKDSIEKYCP